MSKLSNRAVVTISVFCILIGLLLISNDYLKSKKEKAYEKIRISLLSESEKGKKDNTPKKVDEEPEIPVEENPNEYIGILKIEKINLEQGFYDKGNPENDVDRNITFLEPTNYPNEKNGNVILVAHSGSSSIAYFKHLYQLEIGDIAQVTYKGKIYTYKIEDIYYETKDGDVTIYRDKNKSTLTMITCTKDDDTKQTVYIAYLQKVE
ncbi:MAG: sortase [Bacilli bacterium]|nr:sortase [Bacilli bacterium]MBR3208986.1 sortase [Bacilli bacterium]